MLSTRYLVENIFDGIATKLNFVLDEPSSTEKRHDYFVGTIMVILRRIDLVKKQLEKKNHSRSTLAKLGTLGNRFKELADTNSEYSSSELYAEIMLAMSHIE